MNWKKKSIRVCSVLAVFLMFFATVGNVSATSLQEAQQQKADTENRLEQTKKLIEELNASKASTEINIRQLDAKLTEVSERIVSLELQRLEKENQILAAQEEAVYLEKQSKEQYENMKVRIRFMYENSKSSDLELFFSAKSMADLINRAAYIARITEYDRDMLTKYQKTAAMVSQLGGMLEEDKEELIALKEETKLEEEAIALLLAAKEKQLAKLGNDLTDAERLAKLYEAEIQAQDELIGLIQSQGGVGDVDYNGEKFVWPCPSSTRVTSDYGPRVSPTAGASSYHKGIDIGAAYNADIVAAADGVVSFAGYSNSAGNYLIVNHGNGLQTVYMHCASLVAGKGQAVVAGQVIAKVGSTGISTGNHLHFGVSLNGNYVNPWIYLR